MTTTNDIPCIRSTAKRRKQKRTDFISIRVSTTVKDQLLAVAQQQDRPLSWLASRILEKFLNEQKKSAAARSLIT